MEESWEKVYDAESAHTKAEIFQQTLVNKVDEIFPEKIRKISSVDAPWMTQKLKKLDRQRKRVNHKQRRSEKWIALDKHFKKQVKDAKETFYKDMVADLKKKNPSQWYSSLKRISGEETKSQKVEIEEIFDKTDQEQDEDIADYFSSIPNEYEPLMDFCAFFHKI